MHQTNYNHSHDDQSKNMKKFIVLVRPLHHRTLIWVKKARMQLKT
uniref:Uncharacterized protein n=1 Tax=Rhizophora mucronata TaxID=61149 RepID=A0A2P2NJD6_RHIMU